MDIQIRKLSSEEWEVYKELRLQMLSEEPQAYTQRYEELSKRSDDEWKEKTASDTMLLMTIWVDDKLAGMNGLFYEDKETVSIWGMFIRKEFRGKGLGRRLMEAIEEEIRRDPAVKKIMVCVRSSQNSALELYKKLGFTEVGRDVGKVEHNGEVFDEIQLEKLLI